MKSVDSVRIKNADLKENFSLDVGVILKHFLKELLNDTKTHSIFQQPLYNVPILVGLAIFNEKTFLILHHFHFRFIFVL